VVKPKKKKAIQAAWESTTQGEKHDFMQHAEYWEERAQNRDRVQKLKLKETV
jgi:hypothetical protein